MPEILEVEFYRRAAEAVVGRRIVAVHAPDRWFCKGGTTPEELVAVLPGSRVRELGRRGKLLVLLLDSDRTLGLRFGMTGRLVVDDQAAVDELEYSSHRGIEAWDRFGLDFEEGRLRINDPRRLGGVQLDPDLDRLGPDALSITRAELAAAMLAAAPIKAKLLDQSAVAGMGNLLVDETLWRAGFDPARSARSLTPDEVAVLHRTMRQTLKTLLKRGGSHTGDLQGERHRAGRCPRDATPLLRRQVGGRTTYSCPLHQR
ncbi:MAG: putative glycosylase [Acidimicrobiia bacterium]|nr:putative glycosylase [Acidimicrobiia bacterium]